MAEKRKFKRASVEMPSDAYTVTDAHGNEHHPHEGEWVRVCKTRPYRVFMLDSFGETFKVLKRQIVGWNWTDDFGNTLPGPDDPEAFAEALLDLDEDEASFLLATINTAANLPNP